MKFVVQIALVLLFLFPNDVWGQEEFNDSVNRDDENFVKASLMIAAPGQVLYSCLGHACLRLECPVYDLDYCFSYESEDVRDRIFTFLSGNLKMGMFSVPFEEYMEQYKSDGRGVHQYELNLPIGVKRELWRLLDEKCAEGAELPYEYLNRGCAQSVMNILREVLVNTDVEWGGWNEKYNQTRREFVDSNLKNYPWTKMALYLIVGTEGDEDCDNFEKVVVPNDLVDILQHSSIDGKKIIDAQYQEIVPFAEEEKAGFFSPMVVALICLVLAIANRWLKWQPIDWALLAIQTTVGLFLTYLIFFSSLPCTEWNWLIVPFNPLPLLLWKWRRWWSLPFALILLGWIIMMIISSHKLVDTAYLVTAFAFVVMYLGIGNVSKLTNIKR